LHVQFKHFICKWFFICSSFQFFGFVAMVVYGYDAFLKFNAARSGALAQGERVVTKSSSTVTSPAY
jgi:hypothetical protein